MLGLLDLPPVLPLLACPYNTLFPLPRRRFVFRFLAQRVAAYYFRPCLFLDALQKGASVSEMNPQSLKFSAVLCWVKAFPVSSWPSRLSVNVSPRRAFFLFGPGISLAFSLSFALNRSVPSIGLLFFSFESPPVAMFFFI